MAHSIDNTEDVIDSRSVIERIAELEERAEDEDQIEPLDDDEREELEALRALASECEGYSDWEHGETLIRDSYFVQYAQELADDIGAIDRNASWPCNCIDWELAARELQHDYSAVEFGGVRYWIRG